MPSHCQIDFTSPPPYHCPFLMFSCVQTTMSDHDCYTLPSSGRAILMRKGSAELSLLVGLLLFILDNFSKPGHSVWGLGSLSFSYVCTEENRNKEFTVSSQDSG